MSQLKTSGALITLFFVNLMLMPAVKAEMSSDTIYQAGKEAYEAEKYQETINILLPLLRDQGLSVEKKARALLRIAESYLQLKQWEKAKQYYEYLLKTREAENKLHSLAIERLEWLEDNIFLNPPPPVPETPKAAEREQGPRPQGEPAQTKSEPYVFPLEVDFSLLESLELNPDHHHYPAIDIPVPIGTLVKSITDGTIVDIGPPYRENIIWLGPHINNKCGKGVIVQDMDGFLYYYCHFDTLAEDIEVGTIVAAGDFLGTVGTSGNSTGPHLHIAIKEVVVKKGKPHYIKIPPYPILCALQEVALGGKKVRPKCYLEGPKAARKNWPTCRGRRRY